MSFTSIQFPRFAYVGGATDSGACSKAGPAPAPHTYIRPPYTFCYRDRVEEVAGYLVIDRLVRGVAAGGLRVNKGT